MAIRYAVLIPAVAIFGIGGAIAAGIAPFRGLSPIGGSGCAVDPPSRTPEAPPVQADLPAFLDKGVDWLIAAQHKDGGWGAGSHAHQDVRDPNAVPGDPATTAFVGLAFLRIGDTPTTGKHASAVAKATEFLVEAVEQSKDGPRVTELQATQPQTKLGPLVDTALTVQFLSRVVPLLPKGHALADRANAALDKALGKLHGAQMKNGEWGKGGWANALQGSLGTVALESAAAAGKPLPVGALDMARKAQQDRVADSGAVDASEAAGVELYAMAGAGRNAAAQSREALRLVDEGKSAGKVAPEADVDEKSLVAAGATPASAPGLAKAFRVTSAQSARLDDARMLQGFGNNGGEEFLSYMMTSESLVIRGGDEWPKWRTKLEGLLEKVQSADGSWTGHHCITSPVFCTAAVVQAFTADHDVAILRARPNAKAGDAPAGR